MATAALHWDRWDLSCFSRRVLLVSGGGSAVMGGGGLDSTYHTISSPPPPTPSRLSQRVFRVKLLTLWPFAATMQQPEVLVTIPPSMQSPAAKTTPPFTPLNFLFAVWTASSPALIIQTIGICKYIKRMMLAAGRQVFIETN